MNSAKTPAAPPPSSPRLHTPLVPPYFFRCECVCFSPHATVSLCFWVPGTSLQAYREVDWVSALSRSCSSTSCNPPNIGSRPSLPLQRESTARKLLFFAFEGGSSLLFFLCWYPPHPSPCVRVRCCLFRPLALLRAMWIGVGVSRLPGTYVYVLLLRGIPSHYETLCVCGVLRVCFRKVEAQPT